MARRATNDRKREEMAGLMAGLLERGWTIQRIAVYFNLSDSAVRSWKAGKSMGTNDQREELGRMPAADAPEVLEELQKVAASRRRDVEKHEAYLATPREELVANAIAERREEITSGSATTPRPSPRLRQRTSRPMTSAAPTTTAGAWRRRRPSWPTWRPYREQRPEARDQDHRVGEAAPAHHHQEPEGGREGRGELREEKLKNPPLDC